MATAVVNRRSRDAEQTRQIILEAAQHVFAARSFAEAGVREITARAGVNPSLVSRYFGGKLGLYEAALDAALDARLITDLPQKEFGKEIVARFTGASNTHINPLPLLLSGSSESEAREVALKLLRGRVFEPLKRWFGGEDAAVRAARFMIVSTGFFTYRDQLPLAEFSGVLEPGLHRWLERAFQAVVDD